MSVRETVNSQQTFLNGVRERPSECDGAVKAAKRRQRREIEKTVISFELRRQSVRLCMCVYVCVCVQRYSHQEEA